jgi:SAM-dependent methyltransferase
MVLTSALHFTTDWLALREPFDHAARAGVVTTAALDHLVRNPAPLVVDLGCGRGSNLRFLRPRLPRGVRWRLVDHDRVLLDTAARELATEDVELREADLRDAPLGELLDGATLVTAAALIDLVGRPWLGELVAAAEAADAALLVTGTVDGRVAWQPPHPADAAVVEAHAGHQGGDKGFGTALGGAAAPELESILRPRGWHVVSDAADWDGVSDPVLQAAYLAGVLDALRRTPLDAALREDWRRFREAAIADATSRLTVAHRDLFAAPPAGRDDG